MKKSVKIVGIVVLVLAIAISALVLRFVRAADETSELLAAASLANPDLSMVGAGEYFGEFNTPVLAVKVKVTVANQQIVAVEIIEHDHMRGGPAEAIVNTVIERQELLVDHISGATHSSKAILLAIQDALQ